MRKIITKITLLLLATNTFGQWQNKGFTHLGNARQYRVYKPASYNPSNPASLVLTLHGLGDNMTNFSNIGMNAVADTANIIVVVPNAMTDPLLGSTAWNSGAGFMGYYPNSSINDVSFIGALVDTIQSNYAINPDRVYVCGFSMGGFMTNRLAVELNDKFTAYASVAGTFGTGLASYNPGREISIAHFHGTSDNTIYYGGGDYGIGADSLVKFWAGNDVCDPVPVHTNLPNTYSDGYTVEHFVYENGQNNSAVELFKVNGADHVWLTPANDISYTIEIWKFFNKHKTATATSIHENTVSMEASIYPNPTHDAVNIQLNHAEPNDEYQLTVFDISGRPVYTHRYTTPQISLSLKAMDLPGGLYSFHLVGNRTAVTAKVLLAE